MSLIDQTRFIERMQFFSGQRLLAQDLQDLETLNREMRWLHNQSLHQPGIGSGFAVSGVKGDRQVTIGPGYAIDALGREIVLTHPQVEAIPPVHGEADGSPAYYDLAVSYPQDKDLQEAETRQGVCDTQGAVRLIEEPVFCWVRLHKDSQGNLVPNSTAIAQEIQASMQIILTRVEIFNCQINALISIAQRRTARLECGPRLAAGIADPTDWEVLDLQNLSSTALRMTLAEINNPQPIALMATIDTSSGGFEFTPNYSASLPGERLVAFDIDGESTQFLLLDVMRMIRTEPARFTALLLVDLINLGAAPEPEINLRRATPPESAAPAAAPETPASGESPAAAATTTPSLTDQAVAWIQEHWAVQWLGVEG